VEREKALKAEVEAHQAPIPDLTQRLYETKNEKATHLKQGDRKLLSARAVQHEHQSQHILRYPASCALLCHGVVCLVLTPPRPYAAIGLSGGQHEQRLRDEKHATREYDEPRLTTACLQRTGRSEKHVLSLYSTKEPCMTDEELR